MILPIPNHQITDIARATCPLANSHPHPDRAYSPGSVPGPNGDESVIDQVCGLLVYWGKRFFAEHDQHHGQRVVEAVGEDEKETIASVSSLNHEPKPCRPP